MFTKKLLITILLCVLFSPVISVVNPQGRANTTSEARNLRSEVQIIRDRFGVPHIEGKSDEDVYFAMGYVHAEDRFFQMDYARRQANGTLSELVGPGAKDRNLSSDLGARRYGFRRWAEQSRSLYSPETLAILQAYADGVNAWLNNNPLPPEYAGFELTKASIPDWEILDSLAIVKQMAFQLSFDTHDLNFTRLISGYQKSGKENGYDWAKLFFKDAFRAAPFDSTITVTHWQGSESSPRDKSPSGQAGLKNYFIKPQTLQAVNKCMSNLEDFDKEENGLGSNWWVVSGTKAETGLPMLANDPHLPLVLPSTFYAVHLMVDPKAKQGPMNVYGVSIPGMPAVVLGFNDKIAWGASSSHMDVTDYFQEQVVVDEKSKVPVATRYKGKDEPVRIIPEKYRMNNPANNKQDDLTDVPVGKRPDGFTVTDSIALVPRRNNGPIVSLIPTLSSTVLVGISIQFIGFGPTRELEAFLSWARAGDLKDFKRGLQRLDSLTQNWCYADVDGNIAYFASGEIPLREDLEAGALDGAPPFAIRDGSGEHKNEWIKLDNPPADQALHYEIIPFDEMPQVVNPPEGYIVNANNDPIGVSLDNDTFNDRRKNGKALYYIKPWFDPGLRAGRITRFLQQKLNKSAGSNITLKDMMELQGDTYLPDFEIFMPHLFRAFEAAGKPTAPQELAQFVKDPGIVEAIGRLRNWNLTSPTGIPEGYDASDENGKRLPPTEEEIKNSIAATIAISWRGRLVMNSIDAPLKRIGLNGFLPTDTFPLSPLVNYLQNFAQNKGRGETGLNYFDVPDLNLPAEVERDIILLKSLKDALNFLAGEDAENVFKRSTNQDDYRWGKVHRVSFGHTLGAAKPDYSIPPAAGFTNSLPSLRGLSCDGGQATVDAAYHRLRVWDTEGFLFDVGPAWRFVAQAQRGGFKAFEIIPGGESAVIGSEFYANMLALWLTNDYHDAYFTPADVNKSKYLIKILKPKK